ncbi:MAG: hypothetical protein R6U95_06390 [Bacteroidales bacterium]
MKHKLLYIIASLAFCISCNKGNSDLSYQSVGYIEGITINDVLKYTDSTFFFAGENNENEGVIGIYNTGTKESTIKEFDEVVYGLSLSDHAIWACGENLFLYKSRDDGYSWDRVSSFKYVDDVDMSDLKEVYAVGDKPIFGIGYRHMLDGRFYNPNPIPYYPFKISSIKMGPTDMLVFDTTDMYIAGYGSVLHVNGSRAEPIYCDVGGELFTGITRGGDKSVVTCTHSGAIYTFNFIDEEWKKEYDGSIQFRHIIGDTYGNIIAFGNKRYAVVSNDYGDNWAELKYPDARNVTSVSLYDNNFYIGTNKGQIIQFDTEQL